MTGSNGQSPRLGDGDRVGGTSALNAPGSACLMRLAQARAEKRLGITFGGVRVRFRLGDPMMLEHLSRYSLVGDNTTGLLGAGDDDIVSVVDRDLFHAVTHARRRPQAWREIFVGAYARRISLGRGRSGWEVRWLRSSDAAFVIEHGNSRIALVRGDGANARAFPLRLARELALRAAEHRDDGIYHASAVAFDKTSALLICGPSGSGKTTLALLLGRSGSASVISNDYTVVGREKISGIPLIVRIGVGTLSLRSLSGLRAPALTEARPGVVPGGADTLPADWGSSRKFEVYPDQVAADLGVTWDYAGVQLGGVIHVQLSNRGRGNLSIQRLGSQEGMKRLESETLRPVGRPWGDPWCWESYVHRPPTSPGGLRSSALTRSVPHWVVSGAPALVEAAVLDGTLIDVLKA